MNTASPLPDDAALAAFIRAPVRKHSINIAGHATSITLEDPFWEMLKARAAAEKLSLAALVDKIDQLRTTNLSSAIRLYLLYTLKQ